MTRFALIVATWFSCFALCAEEPMMQPPRVPTTELEGVWQEPAPPGETPRLRYRITFAGDEVTIEADGKVTQGTVWLSPDPVRATIHINTGGKGDTETRCSLSGIYRLGKDQLSLQIGPEQVVDLRPGPKFEAFGRSGRERSPITITLMRVK